MQKTPQEELHQALALGSSGDGIDNPQAIRLKRKLAEEFRLPQAQPAAKVHYQP